MIRAERYDEAETAALKALENRPSAVMAMDAMATICSRRGRMREAREWQQKSAESIPVLAAQSAIHPAIEAMRRGDLRKALKLLDVTASSPIPITRQSALQLKAQVYLAMSRFRDAESVLMELEQAGYDEAPKYLIRSKILLAKRDENRAADILHAGIRKYPTNGVMRGDLLRLLSAKGDSVEEASLVEDLVTHLPETPSGLLDAGEALADTGHNEAAYQLWQAGRTNYPAVREFAVLVAAYETEVEDDLDNPDVRDTQREASDRHEQISTIAQILQKWTNWLFPGSSRRHPPS